MNTYITEAASETTEALNNISAAVRAGEFSWQEGEEIKKAILRHMTDEIGLQQMRKVLQTMKGQTK